jgi:hypothetical protein
MLIPLFAIGTIWFYLLLLASLCFLCWAIENESGFGASVVLVATAVALWLFGNVNLFALIVHHPLSAIAYLLGYFVVGLGWACCKWEVYSRDRRSDSEKAKAEYLATHKKPAISVDTMTLDDFRYSCTEKENPAAIDKHGAHPQLRDGYRPNEVEMSTYTVSWEKAKQVEFDRQFKDYNDGLWNALASANLCELDPNGDRGVKTYVRNHKARLTTWMSYWPVSAAVFFLHDFVSRICRTVIDAMHGVLQRRSDAIFSGVNMDISPTPKVVILPAKNP